MVPLNVWLPMVQIYIYIILCSIAVGLYAAYRLNCYAIYDILSTNDGILVNFRRFVFYAHYFWQSTCLSWQ